MNENTRTRGTTVRTLNTDPLATVALEKANAALTEEERKEMTWTRMAPSWRWAIGEAKDGTLYAICSEGVGYRVTDEEPFDLPMIGSWRETESGRQFSGMTANSTVELSPADLRKIAEDGEDVDLADFVRAFGDRLEANFGIWRSKLS